MRGEGWWKLERKFGTRRVGGSGKLKSVFQSGDAGGGEPVKTTPKTASKGAEDGYDFTGTDSYEIIKLKIS
jgi:hypothetical protein